MDPFSCIYKDVNKFSLSSNCKVSLQVTIETPITELLLKMRFGILVVLAFIVITAEIGKQLIGFSNDYTANLILY